MMNLAQYLKKTGQTQVEFASKANISQGIVSMAINGWTGMTFRMARRIIKASDFNVSIETLYDAAFKEDAA